VSSGQYKYWHRFNSKCHEDDARLLVKQARHDASPGRIDGRHPSAVSISTRDPLELRIVR
jgi:hypothetical protein